MKIFISPDDIKQQVAIWLQARQRIAFVPTMGALHKGHLSLVEIAKQHADRVVVSVFVNPLQFGPSEDFARYPRTIKEDTSMLETEGVDAVFLPSAQGMYPDYFQTYVTNSKISKQLCGKSRPGHFDGVLTVVAKLFNIIKPHVAIFGKKDFQQYRLIAQMCRDLAMDIEIIGAPIIRDSDQMALSSRNRYLIEEQRKDALAVPDSLQVAKNVFQKGERSVSTILNSLYEHFESRGYSRDQNDKEKKLQIDYIEIRKSENLGIFDDGLINGNAVLLVAVYCHKVRLIDNLELEYS